MAFTLKYWITHPVRSAQEIVDYRESRIGIPFVIILFMGCARNSTWLMITILVVSPGYFFPIPIIKAFSAFGLFIMYGLWNIFAVPALDFFTSIGFRLWRFLIIQR